MAMAMAMASTHDTIAGGGGGGRFFATAPDFVTEDGFSFPRSQSILSGSLPRSSSSNQPRGNLSSSLCPSRVGAAPSSDHSHIGSDLNKARSLRYGRRCLTDHDCFIFGRDRTLLLQNPSGSRPNSRRGKGENSGGVERNEACLDSRGRGLVHVCAGVCSGRSDGDGGEERAPAWRRGFGQRADMAGERICCEERFFGGRGSAVRNQFRGDSGRQGRGPIAIAATIGRGLGDGYGGRESYAGHEKGDGTRLVQAFDRMGNAWSSSDSDGRTSNEWKSTDGTYPSPAQLSSSSFSSSSSTSSTAPLYPFPTHVIVNPGGAAAPSPAPKPLKLRKLKFGQLRKLKELPLHESVSPVRAVAAVRLIRVEDGGAFVDLIGGEGTGVDKKEMENVARTLGFRVNNLDDRAVRQMTEIVAGVCRWRRYLDFLLACFHNGTARDLEKTEPLLRQILRIGLYELVKLNEAPHVAVHQAVELAKLALRDGAGRRVNGILRSTLRAKEIGRLPVPSIEPDEDEEGGFAKVLAVMHSHPTWLVKRWMRQFGEEETVALLQWNNSRPTFGLRANSVKRMDKEAVVMVLATLGVKCTPSPYLDDFVRLQSGMQAVLSSPLLKEGFCAVQDESAGLMVALLDPQPGDVVVDCCAAPGGKALYAASRLKGRGKIIAIDCHVGRMRTLRKNAFNLGVGKWVETFVADAQRFAEQAAVTADRVLVDAPCSGVGVLSKRADLRWRKKLEKIDELVKLQDQLLDAAVKILRPGGVLVYSTCSIEPRENEERIAAFLTRHPNFVIESGEKFLPASVLSQDGFVSVYPQRHGIDGAFGARLRRLEKKKKTNDGRQDEKHDEEK